MTIVKRNLDLTDPSNKLPKSRAKLWHNFNDDPDGTPSAIDSGANWTLTYGTGGSAGMPTVTSGYYVINDTAAHATAGYLSADLRDPVTYLEADFAFGSGSTEGGAVALIAFKTKLAPGALASPAPDAPCHIAFNHSGFDYAKIVSNTFTTISSVAYGGTVDSQHVEVALDRYNGVAYILAANNSIYAVIDSGIKTVEAPFACCEIYYGNSSTDRRIFVSRFSADTTAVDVPSAYPSRARTLRHLYQLSAAAFTNDSLKVDKTATAWRLYGTDGAGSQVAWPLTNDGSPYSIPYRDISGNVAADGFVSGFSSTATAAGTTVLTVDSSQDQQFTGSTTQTMTLPTTGIVAGQNFLIINDSTGNVTINASGGGNLTTLASGFSCTVLAKAAAPTTAGNWSLLNVFATSTGFIDKAATANTLAQRNAQANLVADAFVPGYSPITSAAGTTTLTVDSVEVQTLIGSTTQTFVLPTTNVVAGQRFTIHNKSTGNAVIQASGGSNLLGGLNSGFSAIITAQVNAPTAPTDWVHQLTYGIGIGSTSQASTIAQRDVNANLSADAFIPGYNSTVTAAGTTTLTVDSVEEQAFTGSSTQTLVLPTTSVVAGQRFNVINDSTGGNVTINASAGGLLGLLTAGYSCTLVAKAATPTTAAQWSIQNAFATSTAFIDKASTGSTLAQRTSQANIVADAFIPGFTTTATAAGTTTLTVDSTEEQQFTGATTQTCVLPTTSLAAGHRFTIANDSTGAVTVQSSGANTILSISGNVRMTVMANVATPTTAAHWDVIAIGSANNVTAGAAANTYVLRDGQANILADAFVKGTALTATASGTTTLTVDSVEQQIFTGSVGQICVLPTTNVVAGQAYLVNNQSSGGTITVNASGGATVVSLNSTNWSMVAIALQAAPTTAAHWAFYLAYTYSPSSTGAVALSIALRDSQTNIKADAFIAAYLATATAAGTTVLTVDSVQEQEFTGSTTQTVTLPTTTVAAGQNFWFWNNSSGVVTVNASDATLLYAIPAGAWLRAVSKQATPTTNTHWNKAA